MDVSSVINAFLSVIKTFSIADFVDIAVVSFIIYSLIKIMRETRAEQLVKGILILVVAYGLAYQFKLKMLSTILNSFFQFTVLVLLVVFQPELRRALEQIGRSKIGGYWSFATSIADEEEYIKAQREAIKSVTSACVSFQKNKTGALIVFERQTKLGEIIDTGTIINASPSVAIIGNIFYNKAPLHDGAMIIRNGKIYAAGCILPLTQNENVSIDLGTRHRAAMGMSENSDAVIVVVSEETGSISLAVNGVLNRNYTRETLERELEKLLIQKTIDSRDRKIKYKEKSEK